MTTYTRPADDLRVGGDIDAQCGKCRQTTNHRIVSMVDGVVKHVICLTCNSKHNYRVPVVVAPKKTGPAAKVKAATKAARASRESAAQKETMESKAIKEPKAAKSAASKAPKAASKSTSKEVKATKEAKAPKAPKQSKEAVVKEPKKVAQDEGDQYYKHWLELKAGLGTGKFKNYSLDASYELNDVIEHPHFGLGFVTRVILPAKIQVLFERSHKTLIMNLHQD